MVVCWVTGNGRFLHKIVYCIVCLFSFHHKCLCMVHTLAHDFIAKIGSYKEFLRVRARIAHYPPTHFALSLSSSSFSLVPLSFYLPPEYISVPISFSLRVRVCMRACALSLSLSLPSFSLPPSLFPSSSSPLPEYLSVPFAFSSWQTYARVCAVQTRRHTHTHYNHNPPHLPPCCSP